MNAHSDHGLPKRSIRNPNMHASAAEVWVDQLPGRWAGTGAAAGLVVSAAIFLSPSRPLDMAQALPAALVITAAAGFGWLLLGYWARWSLRPHMQQSPYGALAAIRDNWLSGSAILVGVPIILRRAAVELGLYHYAPPTEFDDFIAAVIAFPTMMLGAYVLSVISRRALASRIQ